VPPNKPDKHTAFFELKWHNISVVIKLPAQAKIVEPIKHDAGMH